MSFVLDSSVALTWCFEDQRTPATADLLEQVGQAGAVAPMLWPLEALNGLLVAERRGRLDADRRQLLASFLSALPIELDEETAGQVWTETARMAERFAFRATMPRISNSLDVGNFRWRLWTRICEEPLLPQGLKFWVGNDPSSVDGHNRQENSCSSR